MEEQSQKSILQINEVDIEYGGDIKSHQWFNNITNNSDCEIRRNVNHIKIDPTYFLRFFSTPAG
jgi:hypothetical protein